MKKFNFFLSFLFLFSLSISAQTYVERLSRGVVALPAEKGNFISWRFLSTDAPKTTFSILRNGDVIASNLTRETCFTDTLGTKDSRYSVQTIVKGSVEETSEEVTPWDKPYLSVPLIRPLDQEMPDGTTCSYTPNHCSAADVD
jgi:rhamnogalacturonan endolyase